MSRGLKSHANKRDGNEAGLVAILRAHGLTVTLHDEPWDLCCTVGTLSRWAEVKAPRNKRGDAKPFTETQNARLRTWPDGHVDVLVSDADAVRFAQLLKHDERLLRMGKAA